MLEYNTSVDSILKAKRDEKNYGIPYHNTIKHTCHVNWS